MSTTQEWVDDERIKNYHLNGFPGWICLFQRDWPFQDFSLCERSHPPCDCFKESCERLLSIPSTTTPTTTPPPRPLYATTVCWCLKLIKGPFWERDSSLRGTELDTSLPSRVPLPCRSLLPKAPQTKPQDSGADRSRRPVSGRQLLFEPSSDRKIKSGSEGSGKHCAMSLLKAADASFGVTCCGWWVWMMWGFR